jgi:hypothetical protein
MQASLQKLSKDKQDLAYDWASQPAKIPAEASPEQIRAIYEIFRYRLGPAVVLSMEESEKEKIILNKLAAAPASAVKVTPPAPPEKGHASGKWGLYIGKANASVFQQLQFRAAYHDLLDNSDGYDPFGELRMVELNWRWNQKKLFLQNTSLVRIVSVAPGSYRNPKVSWNFDLGANANPEQGCIGWNCIGPKTSGGFGWSFNFFRGQEQTFFAFLQLDFELAKNLAKGGRMSWGPYLGWRWPIYSWWRVLVEWQRKEAIWGAPTISIWQASSAIALGKKIDARFWRKNWEKEREWGTGLSFYF